MYILPTLSEKLAIWFKRLTVVTGILITFCALSVTPVAAQGLKGEACDAAGTAQVSNCGIGGGATARSQFSKVAVTIANIFSLLVGAISVIMIIIGGFRYVISGGDSNGVQSAKNTIIYALVGLVIVLFAQVIARFVLSSVS